MSGALHPVREGRRRRSALPGILFLAALGGLWLMIAVQVAIGIARWIG